LSIALKYKDGMTFGDEYVTNIAKGCGKDLLAILGSRSMQQKDAVIILREVKEMMVFPGQGGYKIEWAEGAKMLPITRAPSGHLVIRCDHFDEAVTTSTTTYMTDHALPGEGEAPVKPFQ
jgi:hypothetical protein